MNIEYKADPNRVDFDKFVKSHPLGSMFQMSGWSIVKREWKSLRLIGVSDGEIVCAAQILVRSFPLGQKLFYIPRGPLCYDEQVKKDFFRYIKDIAKEQGAFCVKFDPSLVVRQFDHNGELVKENSEIVNSFLEIDKDIVHKGFEKSLNVYAQPRYNAIVMATEDMVEHFSSSTKRNIKIALKKNVIADRFSHEKLESFALLMDLTEQRKGVSLRNQEYFKRFFNAFENHVHLFMASLNLKDSLVECESMIQQLQQSLELASIETSQVKQQGIHYEALLKERVILADMSGKYGDIVDIGGLLVLIHNNTCEFLYSGMNAEFSKFYPAYLMRLKAMEYARSQGCVHLNFGGIPGSLDDGLWEFKRSFGAYVIEYVGEFDVIIRPMIYHLFEKALPLAKRVVRKIRKFNNESK